MNLTPRNRLRLALTIIQSLLDDNTRTKRKNNKLEINAITRF